MRKIRNIRAAVGDRAVLRAMHFFADNERVEEQAEALKNGNFETFKDLSIQSGRSSFMYLQDVFSSSHVAEQGLSLALAISESILQGWGPWRVHGGGFAGTIQAFVPYDLLEPYKSELEAVFGAGSCHVLSIRSAGGVKVQL
jgi:galactokinase